MTVFGYQFEYQPIGSTRALAGRVKPTRKPTEPFQTETCVHRNCPRHVVRVMHRLRYYLTPIHTILYDRFPFSFLLTSQHTRLWTTRLSPALSHILGDSSISLINFYFLRLTDMNLPHGSLSHTEECVWVMVCLLFQPLFWFGGCCAFPGRGIFGVWWTCRGRSCRKLLSF